jgi:hypothetical protein
MIPYIDVCGHPSIGYTVFNEDGKAVTIKKKICNLIMETFVDGFNTKTMKVIHRDDNKQNLIYDPSSPLNNLIPLTYSEYMSWRMNNDPRMKHKTRKDK